MADDEEKTWQRNSHIFIAECTVEEGSKDCMQHYLVALRTDVAVTICV